MLEAVEINQTYRSFSGYLFHVDGFAQHAQDCSIRMVIYTNLEPTFDSPVGKQWVLEESIFLKRFSTVQGNTMNTDTHLEGAESLLNQEIK